MLQLRGRLHLDLLIDNETMGVRDAQAPLSLSKRSGESYQHVLLKLLGFVLFYHPELQVEVSAGQHHKPDLVRFDARGEPVQWVECGLIKRRKLDRISARNKLTFIDVIKATETEMRSYARSTRGHLRAPERVRYFGFRRGFVDELAEAVYDHATVRARVTGPRWDALVALIDDIELHTPVVCELGQGE
ncbi:MAG: YaeQ family protein [Alphaproteobacteria bacterium]|nr:YaeQ family protein [Alphaproteobacteria bacterium]